VETKKVLGMMAWRMPPLESVDKRLYYSTAAAVLPSPADGDKGTLSSLAFRVVRHKVGHVLPRSQSWKEIYVVKRRWTHGPHGGYMIACRSSTRQSISQTDRYVVSIRRDKQSLADERGPSHNERRNDERKGNSRN
jgi:hypothetical protein